MDSFNPLENQVLPGTGKSLDSAETLASLKGSKTWAAEKNSLRQSSLVSRTLRAAPAEETSKSSQFLLRGGYIDKTGSGIYSLLPLGLRVVDKIERLVSDGMRDLGSQRLAFPILQPRAMLEQTGRWGIDVLYKMKGRGDKDLSLAFTHEENCAHYMGRVIHSYHDLPASVFQINTKFRDEPRAKNGIMRGKEFRMKDMYSFHASQEDLNQYYDLAHLKYMEIFRELGLGDRTFLTFASGGDYAKYSHEYQTICDIGEDTIHLCQDSGIAINKEILDDLGGKCPVSGSSNLTEHRAVEVGNIFKLGTRFTNAYGYRYLDASGNPQPIYMASYGIGITRIVGTIAELHNDAKGIIWPKAVAPYEVHLISIGSDPATEQKAEELFSQLTCAGAEVLYDDRRSVRGGEKFADSDLYGIPLRIVVSDKGLETGRIEYKERNQPAPYFSNAGDAVETALKFID